MKGKMLSESSDMTKAEIKKLVKDEIEAALKKIEKDFISEKEARELVKTMLINQYKFLWQKSSFFVNNI
jgi:chemotaxis methyl-accepting protein methylase